MSRSKRRPAPIYPDSSLHDEDEATIDPPAPRESCTDGYYRPAGSLRATIKKLAQEDTSKWKRVKLWCTPAFNFCHLPLLALVTLAFLLALMLPTYFVFARERQDLRNTIYADPPELSSAEWNASIMIVLGRVQTYDPNSYTAAMSYTMYLIGALASGARYGVVEIPEGFKVVLTLGNTVFQIKSGDSLVGQTSHELMIELKPRIDYPFDSYEMMFVVSCFVNIDGEANIWDDNDKPANFTPIPVPLGVMLATSSQGYYTTAKLIRTDYRSWVGTDSMSDYSLGTSEGAIAGNKSIVDSIYGPVYLSYLAPIVVQMNIKRQSAVKFFSLFIIVLMWLLSLGLFAIAIDNVFIRKATITYESPSLALGMLFTLPFVREVQPSIPDIGLTVDFLGFFWNMGLIAATAIFLLLVLGCQSRAEILSHKVEKRSELANSITPLKDDVNGESHV